MGFSGKENPKIVYDDDEDMSCMHGVTSPLSHATHRGAEVKFTKKAFSRALRTRKSETATAIS